MSLQDLRATCMLAGASSTSRISFFLFGALMSASEFLGRQMALRGRSASNSVRAAVEIELIDGRAEGFETPASTLPASSTGDFLDGIGGIAVVGVDQRLEPRNRACRSFWVRTRTATAWRYRRRLAQSRVGCAATCGSSDDSKSHKVGTERIRLADGALDLRRPPDCTIQIPILPATPFTV